MTDQALQQFIQEILQKNDHLQMEVRRLSAEVSELKDKSTLFHKALNALARRIRPCEERLIQSKKIELESLFNQK